jgi:5-methylthioadenosine/S-adenosylhomocysteine deaminase
MVDFLIKGGLVYPMDPSRKVIKDGAVAVENDRIVGVGTTEELESRFNVD